MRMLKLLQSAILGAAVWTAIIVAGGAAEPPTAAKQHVLCWYMVCYGSSVEVYKQEIALAQRHGIDGFLLDVGEWKSGSPGQLKPTHYVESADRMYEAARQLGTGFLLAMAPEYSGQPFPENVQDMVLRFDNHPNQFRRNGKAVLSGYCGASMFPTAVEKLKAAGVAVCLVPHVLLPRFAYRPGIETFTREFAATPCLDGLMMFNPVELGSVISDNAAVKDSGFSMPVQGLTTATYNIRIRYSNPSGEEARLTLFADGPPRAAGDYPYFLPAFLPPTGKGEFRVVSFFWSLYDTTRTLKLQWEPGQMWGQPAPADDDHGIVLVEAIELVKVDPIVLPKSRHSALPEMAWIPGGKFLMGSDRGEPDEKPRHPVTISGFTMGKYVVTNGQFERFDPDHRQFRNGNSWRDREPVLHVSWVDAAKYCNWLSGQVGLTPVYAEQAIDPVKPGEKYWVADFKADGFRLPTEAEREYAATGRGEGRTYPWGEAAPVPRLHGWFQGRAALGSRLPRPATEQTGAVVVGSFPAGASRDGVMDMAGNVGQWCNDWYEEYTPQAQTDPCQTKPGNYRVIRGGSWSWYGHSQRGSRREFNSQNYPGHAYYGFRVVLPESGWEKVGYQP